MLVKWLLVGQEVLCTRPNQLLSSLSRLTSALLDKLLHTAVNSFCCCHIYLDANVLVDIESCLYGNASMRKLVTFIPNLIPNVLTQQGAFLRTYAEAA